MAATVKVNVNVNDAEALVQLSNLDTKIDQLNKKSIDIKVNTGAAGSGSTKAATKEVRELDDVLAQAGFSTSQLGAQTKLTSRIVEGEVAKVVGTWEQGIGKTVKASSDGTVQVTEDYKKQAKESEKAAAVQEEATAKAWAGIKRVTKIGAAIATAFVVKQVKESLDTMRDVDAELANIRKVTGESEAVIARLGETAYETASKYGVTATEYLSSAADFAKAGYGNYATLAELAIKTQLVGDVTDETATKFLLSADAAFKFGGNVKQLSTVLDKANEIENNYATSIYKLAEGFPIVASTASMANMTIDETMAAIGTITATTQETGRKAATALRALIMNITKEIGESLEDELGSFEVTEDSVKSMTQALIKYGDAAISAAAAAGEVIDPLEAIRSLATAYKNGEMSRSELFSLLMDIGGKLRTNQLAALIENFDMFEEMLGRVENSSGSAEKEVEVMLSTWDSKINQLDNTWTQFVSHVTDVSAIKGAIEQITGFLGMIDEALVKIKEEAYEGAEKKQAEVEKNYEDLFGVHGEYRQELDALNANYKNLSEYDRKRLEYLTAQQEAMSGQVEAARNLTKEAKVDYLNETIFGENLVIDEETWTYVPERVSRAYKQLQAFQKEYSEAIVEDGSKNKRETEVALNATLDAYKDFYGMIKELQDDGVEVGKDAEEFAKAYEAAMVRAKQATREAKEERDKFGELSLKDRFDYYSGINREVEEIAQMEAEEAEVELNVSADVSEAEDNIDGLNGTEVTADVGADISSAESTIDSLNGRSVTINGFLSIGGIGGIGGAGGLDTTDVNAGFATAEGTKNAPGGPSLVNELGPELISDNGRAYIANGGKPAIVNLSRGAIVLTAEETRQALGNASINNGINAHASGLFNQTTSGKTSPILINLPTGGTFNLGNTRDGLLSITSLPTKTKDTPPGGNRQHGGGGGGSGGGSGDSSSDSDDPWKDKEDALKDALSELDELAKWYHNQKKHTEEGNTYAEAIKKIDALRKEYLNAGYAETSKEVTTLANKIFDYEKDISEAKAHAIDDLEKELDVLKSQIELAKNQGDLNRMLELQNDAQKKVAQLIEAYRAAGFSDTSPEILKLANMGFDYASDSGSTMKDLWKNLIDAIEDMRDTQDDANTLAEKQLALGEAREALTNAQNQRTVRIFNPVTGQWEWVADAKSVKQAQENLTSAEQALLKEQQSQELNALKKAMENGGSLSDVSIGPGLSALLSGASLQQTDAFASALGLLSGGFASTADTSSKSIFDSVDSHDNVTQYTFNGVTIDAATAERTTLAQLTQMITPLALTNNMPA